VPTNPNRLTNLKPVREAIAGMVTSLAPGGHPQRDVWHICIKCGSRFKGSRGDGACQNSVCRSNSVPDR
jgi:hypothetical protein